MENRTINDDEKHRQPITINARLQKAIAKRDLFLGQNPHLEAYQVKIDEMLDKAGNHQGRLAVLGLLMQGKLIEMQCELNKLAPTLQKPERFRVKAPKGKS